jgi:hypothetical protein
VHGTYRAIFFAVSAAIEVRPAEVGAEVASREEICIPSGIGLDKPSHGDGEFSQGESSAVDELRSSDVPSETTSSADMSSEVPSSSDPELISPPSEFILQSFSKFEDARGVVQVNSSEFRDSSVLNASLSGTRCRSDWVRLAAPGDTSSRRHRRPVSMATSTACVRSSGLSLPFDRKTSAKFCSTLSFLSHILTF